MAMTDEITLSSRLVCLGEAMAPVVRKLDAAVAEQSLPTVPVGSRVDVIKEGLAALGRSMPRLAVARAAGRACVPRACGDEPMPYQN